MFYLIEQSVFREVNEMTLMNSLDKLGLDYEVIQCPPFTTELAFNTQRKDVFCFGSVKMARLAARESFKPGSFYGGAHDFEVYRQYYKDNLLNGDCKIHNISDILEWQPNEVKFIRPTKDSKLFNGQLFSQVKWEDTQTSVLKYMEQSHVDASGTIQVGEKKKIYKEARIWIVNGKIVTHSYYQFHNNYVFEPEVSQEGLDFAKQMVSLYQVAPAFVMDICLTPDGWRIVEINCVNCAGFYMGDLQKLLMALEETFNETPIKNDN